ncbi:MAG: class I SAM-dependent methyltransferase [marine benthic group bacterium]|nr:class I SAM-dependent methyltransferase [Candidatus Benthicola marisminoris]
MSEYDPSTYGDRVADMYDVWYPGGNPAPMVDRLEALAGDGPVLELGMGTGRIALPLAATGVPVHGIDASSAMVEKLRAKPGGASIPVTISDFTEFDLEDRFSLVFVVFNTFFGILDQEDQVRGFQSVAGHLAPGGRFLLECFVPDLGRFDRGQRLSVAAIDDDAIRIEASMYDPVAQRVTAQVVCMTESGSRFYPLKVRYCWPSELDLMARLAGLELEHRWGGWNEEPFTAASGQHVTVYRKPG